jgi:predicted nucleic acid-binding Zn ribbon protein
MKKIIAVLGTILTLSAVAAPTFAATAMTAKPGMMSAKTLKCPSCGMPMPMHKTAEMTVPIKIKGATYYCCAMCPSGKKAAMMNAKAAKKM